MGKDGAWSSQRGSARDVAGAEAVDRDLERLLWRYKLRTPLFKLSMTLWPNTKRLSKSPYQTPGGPTADQNGLCDSRTAPAPGKGAKKTSISGNESTASQATRGSSTMSGAACCRGGPLQRTSNPEQVLLLLHWNQQKVTAGPARGLGGQDQEVEVTGQRRGPRPGKRPRQESDIVVYSYV